MTYLQIVNKVMTRLRERQVSSVSETTYSAMVGEYVNDSKKQIEDTWDWSQNRQIIEVSTTASTPTVTLTGFGQEGKVLSAFNATLRKEMVDTSQSWFDKQNYTTEVPENNPYKYTFRGEDSSDDSIVELWPTPAGVDNLKFNSCIPQAELDADGDTINIPWRPVVLLAVAMLSEEKGESDGTTSQRFFKIADKSISDAIAFDAAKHPLENIWYGV